MENKKTIHNRLGVCCWTEDGYGLWHTDCAGSFELIEGTPMLNDMRFCCYCGKPLEQIDFEELLDFEKLQGGREGDMLREAKSEIDRLRNALEKIISDGDYTAPEGMTRIARDALAPNV